MALPGMFFSRGKSRCWLTQEEANDSFTCLQQNAFHMLWETYQAFDGLSQPEVGPSKEKRDTVDQEHTLQKYSIPSARRYGRSFQIWTRTLGVTSPSRATTSCPHWRVRHPGDDWEELSCC